MFAGDLRSRVEKAASVVRGFHPQPVRAGLILGSGLGELADEVEEATVVPYQQIPGFPVSSVSGHLGVLVLGRLEGLPVAVMRGRVHYYEGLSMQEITFPVRVMRELGARTLIVTNASGGISEELQAGDLMVLSDHINLMGDNPLRGPNDEYFGPRFPPMSRAYPVQLRQLAHRVAERLGITLREGVYCALAGPSYETPAEVRMLARLGADAVGMSTAPEVIVAVHGGMQVLGISCVTNVLHQGPSEDTHEDVLAASARAAPRFIRLLRGIARELAEER